MGTSEMIAGEKATVSGGSIRKRFDFENVYLPSLP
jgi:hypothetical protein